MSDVIALGIDIGGTNVKVALVKADGDVIAQGSVPTAPERGPEIFVKAVADYARQLTRENEIEWATIVGAGVGMAAFLDVERGWVEESVNLHWRDVPIVELLEKALDKPVRIDNDANVAALGEAWLGAGRKAKTSLCITLGTGVGGGIVIDGHIHRGASTMAGEIGHIHVKNQGALCNCGHYGCLETLSSATAIVRAGKEAGLVGADGDLTAKDIFALAGQGNDVAQGVIDDMIYWLAVGLGVAANLLNPNVIVITGGVVNAGEALLRPLREAFAKEALIRVARVCEIVPAELGSEAGVLGAARLALQAVAS